VSIARIIGLLGAKTGLAINNHSAALAGLTRGAARVASGWVGLAAGAGKGF